jgi:hypothetical protein
MTRRVLQVSVATALAVWLAGQPAWGHSFPEVRSVVAQVEPCELVLLVGYRPKSGEVTETILRRTATAPKSKGLDALRDVLASYAMAPLSVALDGKRLVPTGVQAKVGVEQGGARPWVVMLVTYALPAGNSLAIGTAEPRSTRISWQDRKSGRVEISTAPKEGTWHAGVASFLLELAAPSGAISCAKPSASSVSSSPPAR